MGLITSTRSDNYAYRVYDEAAVKRLEQILILRKLNISIKDIRCIFNTSGSEIVIEVLGKKVDDIDEEVSLLHELKEIILEFIHQIEQADFGKESDVKLLYEKAKELEAQIVNVDYDGNAANVNRFLEVTKKLEKKEDIIKKSTTFSMGFNVARNDKEIVEVFEFYEKAFGAIKLAEFIPYNTHIHIIMEIHGVQVLLNQDAEYTNKQKHYGGLWAYDNDDDLKKTISILSQNAIKVSMYSWEHWPICAIIIDKYGVEWLLHN
jgi:DNA-binding transcriptional MerR regulator/uncharacterized glyoxalase superfamily protein PhnB